jgi:hypothetical protein
MKATGAESQSEYLLPRETLLFLRTRIEERIEDKTETEIALVTMQKWPSVVAWIAGCAEGEPVAEVVLVTLKNWTGVVRLVESVFDRSSKLLRNSQVQRCKQTPKSKT